MRRNINDYKLYVFDLDGTLYDQPRLRLVMAKRLLMYYMLHPFSVGDLLILQHFRSVKDNWEGSSSEDEIIKRVAEDKKCNTDRVKGIVRKWIYDNPLSALPATKDERLAGWIKKLRSKGRKVVILADYPTADKLRALNIEADGQYRPDDPRIDELKPSPKGLLAVMEDLNIPCEDILMIGDRAEKDGKCAENAGVDHLILARKVGRRNYEEFEH